MKVTQTLEAVDRVLESEQDSGNRNHLGASIIGGKCARKIWYSFYWAKQATFKGRILRLFERGHLEEERFIGYLEKIGCEVWQHGADGHNQIRFKDVDGHFGGSLDGICVGIPELPENAPCLLEFKTHGDNSFKTLEKQGVYNSKFEHFVQMQIYMQKMDLQYGLYMAVNKNTDAWHTELIELDRELAKQYTDRARKIIYSDEAPLRISNEASFYVCRFCDFTEICHKQEIPNINCRTCAHSTPVKEGQWNCARDWAIGNEVQIEKGCSDHVYNPHMINRVEIIGGDAEENYLELKTNSGHVFKHGPGHVTSKQIKDDGIPNEPA
mgnify:FL=1